MARKNATTKAAEQSAKIAADKAAAESRAAATQGRCVIALAVTPDFKAHIEKLAGDAKQSVSVFVTTAAAKQVGFVGTAVPVRAGKRTKYATKEEAKAAQRKAAADRNKKMAELLKLFKAGKLVVAS